MAGNSSVQFLGIDSVLEAYDNADVPCFSLWSGKVMLLRYDSVLPGGETRKPTIEEGVQLLNNYLSAMYQRTAAIYTLRVYEDLPDGKKIFPSTEYSTAFNFKLYELNQLGAAYPSQNNSRSSFDELQDLKEELAELKGENQKNEKKSLIGLITGGLVSGNDELKELIAIGKMLFDKPVMQPNPAMMAGITEPVKTEQKVSDISSEAGQGENEKQKRLSAAIETLGNADDKIVEHLEILAGIAKNDRSQFLNFVKMLDMIK